MARKKLAIPHTKVIGMAPAAQDYYAQVEKKLLANLAKIRQLPVATLVWGACPTSSDPASDLRIMLRDELLREHHTAFFSEDLIDRTCGISWQAQQLAQVEASDIVFSIPDSPGAIAEIHEFAKLPRVSNKIVVFLNEDYSDGYSNASIMQLESVATCKVVPYNAKDLPTCVLRPAIDMVHRLQEVHYICGRRI